MNERLITEKQERALRLVHHDFGGLTQADAAERMGISQPALSELLAAVKKVMPDWFPILTPFEAKCYYYYIVGGCSVRNTAIALDKPESAIYDALGRARDKGKFFPGAKHKVLQYDLSMDNHVKEKF